MKVARSWIRGLVPSALLEMRRRRLRLSRLNLTSSRQAAEDVETTRFDLWPPWLRKSPEPFVLVDVGANGGQFTAAAGRLRPIDTVYAFEPQPECHSSLRDVMQLFKNGVLFPLAVGRAGGELMFHQTSNSKMGSILRPLAGVAEYYDSGDMLVSGKESVRVTRLDDVIPPNLQIDLLKIDVQGYELPVLEGAHSTLQKTLAILLEVNYVAHYEGSPRFDDVFSVVRSHGFRTFGVSAPYCGKEGPLWADAMFVREELSWTGTVSLRAPN